MFFLKFIYRYRNQVHTKHENLLSMSLESKQKQDREQMQFIAIEVFIYLLIYI